MNLSNSHEKNNSEEKSTNFLYYENEYVGKYSHAASLCNVSKTFTTLYINKNSAESRILLMEHKYPPPYFFVLCLF